MKILEKKLNGYFLNCDMFVMIADVQLKEGAEDDFKSWFSESNKSYLVSLDLYLENF